MSEVPELREWFEDTDKQRHAAQLGMWIFLTSEFLLFGALFGLYTAYRVIYSEGFAAAAHHNNVVIGTANTFLLITSSFVVAWAVHAIRHDRRKTTTLCLALTVLMGATFLGLKALEYRNHIEHGLLPGAHYHSQEITQEGANVFFTLYWFMTGLHALHVFGGMIALSVIAALTWRGRMRAAYHTPVENGGLYWHLVDVIWIFLWPLLYLAG